MKLLVFLLLPCLSLSEVGKDFSKCKKFFLNGVSPQFTPSLSSTVHICQCLWYNEGNGDKMDYFYGTLYNKAWMIPVYSAYVFKSPNTERENPWYIEPQLDGVNLQCMSYQSQATGKYQALDRDYVGSGYDKGHLYPVQHTNNYFSMLATSTLTNAAPQDLSFNRGPWRVHEEAVTADLSGCDKGTDAYVVTGVIPDNKNINDRVRVSKYYWTATCCLKNGVTTGKGYYGPNNNGKVEPLSIADLQKGLANEYGVNVKIFPGISNTGCN